MGMHHSLSLTRILVLTGIMALPAIAQAELYRFTDESGRTMYSDKVPQAFSQQGHNVLSNDAITLKEVPRRKSDSEIQAERIAELKRESKRREQDIKRRKDRALLHTFTSVDQINRLRDDRLALINANILVASSKIDRIQATLDEAKIERAKYTADNKAVPMQLEKNIQSYYNRIVIYENQIKINTRRRDIVIEKFSKDRERFEQLLSQHSDP